MFLQLLLVLVVAYYVYPYLYSLYKSFTFKPLPPFTGKRKFPSLEQWVKDNASDKSRRFLPCTNPGTNEPLCEPLPCMNADDVRQRIQVAKQEQVEWAKTSFEARKYVLLRLLDEILAQKHQICAASSSDSGKALTEAYLGEIFTSCAKIQYMLQHGEKYLQPESRSVPLIMMLKRAWVEYFPCGVVGMIVPANYPFHNVLGSIVTALFSGNAVVCKPSEWSTWCVVTVFEKIFSKVLMDCGYSPDLVQFVIGFGDVGEALIRGGVDHVFFIGSPETGKKVMKSASDLLTPVTLELGGKDPLIICEDSKPDDIMDFILRGVFINCGQNCVAAERLYVHEKIYEEFKTKVVAAAKKLRQGPTYATKSIEDELPCVYDSGAMTMQVQIEKIEELIKDAVSKGAKVELGGKRNTTGDAAKGQFFEITILSNVTHDMRIVTEEAFGPVMLLLKWSNDDEVVKMANATEYGLGSYCFSKDVKRAEKILRQIDCGISMVNDYGVFYIIQDLPFGGTKKSGFGKFNGPEGLRAFCKQKSFVSDLIPGMLMGAPAFVQYPYQKYSHQAMGQLLDILYSPNWMLKVKAVGKIISILLFGKK